MADKNNETLDKYFYMVYNIKMECNRPRADVFTFPLALFGGDKRDTPDKSKRKSVFQK